jgi:hypothetical protein
LYKSRSKRIACNLSQLELRLEGTIFPISLSLQDWIVRISSIVSRHCASAPREKSAFSKYMCMYPAKGLNMGGDEVQKSSPGGVPDTTNSRIRAASFAVDLEKLLAK